MPQPSPGANANIESTHSNHHVDSAKDNPSAELLHYETLEIIKAYEENRLKIHGLVDDAEALDLHLSQSRTENRLVIFEGENETGKSTLIKNACAALRRSCITVLIWTNTMNCDEEVNKMPYANWISH